MKTTYRSELVRAYLDEVCAAIEGKRQRSPWAEWMKRTSLPLVVGATVAGTAACGNDEHLGNGGDGTGGAATGGAASTGGGATDGGATNMVETAGAAGAMVGTLYGIPYEICTDGQDNDADGRTDCDDGDCDDDPVCRDVPLYSIPF